MKEKIFTRYEAFVIAILAFLQFTVVLDFMVLSPLGAILMPELSIKPAQFGMVVSAYAFSAGASGFLAAGFADRFDRKRLLLFFYAGFILGTTLCALADNYHDLLIARIITGSFWRCLKFDQLRHHHRHFQNGSERPRHGLCADVVCFKSGSRHTHRVVPCK